MIPYAVIGNTGKEGNGNKSVWSSKHRESKEGGSKYSLEDSRKSQKNIRYEDVKPSYGDKGIDHFNIQMKGEVERYSYEGLNPHTRKLIKDVGYNEQYEKEGYPSKGHRQPSLQMEQKEQVVSGAKRKNLFRELGPFSKQKTYTNEIQFTNKELEALRSQEGKVQYYPGSQSDRVKILFNDTMRPASQYEDESKLADISKMHKEGSFSFEPIKYNERGINQLNKMAPSGKFDESFQSGGESSFQVFDPYKKGTRAPIFMNPHVQEFQQSSKSSAYVQNNGKEITFNPISQSEVNPVRRNLKRELNGANQSNVYDEGEKKYTRKHIFGEESGEYKKKEQTGQKHSKNQLNLEVIY